MINYINNVFLLPLFDEKALKSKLAFLTFLSKILVFMVVGIFKISNQVKTKSSKIAIKPRI